MMQVRSLSDAFYITLFYFSEDIGMRKDKLTIIKEFLQDHYMAVFPVIVLIVAAVTVAIALGARNEPEGNVVASESGETVEPGTVPSETAAEDVPLLQNEDTEIRQFVEAYFQAKGDGNTEELLALCDEMNETDIVYFEELSRYIDHYSDLEIYTKEGLGEDSVVAYVYYKMGIVDYSEVPGYETLYICRRESGELYKKNEMNFLPEEREYITSLNEQVDVVEFNNRVNVEYNELMTNDPKLLEYLGILGEQVNGRVGEILAEHHLGENGQEGEGNGGETVDPSQNGGDTEGGSDAQPVAQYAVAKATVNVRSSDSEKADKLGKATKGSRLQIVEQRVNGWTKVLYEGKEGFIKSEYLRVEDTAASFEAIGKVTATTNVSIRAAATTDSDRLGTLPGGDSLELIAEEGDWCKVKFGSQVGFIKSEYVTVQLN